MMVTQAGFYHDCFWKILGAVREDNVDQGLRVFCYPRGVFSHFEQSLDLKEHVSVNYLTPSLKSRNSCLLIIAIFVYEISLVALDEFILISKFTHLKCLINPAGNLGLQK